MKTFRKKNSGIAAVESLIVLPVILLILAAIVEFGTAFIRYNTLSKAVQNAVRYSISDVYGTLDPTAIANTTAIKNWVVYGQKQTPSDGDTISNRFLDSITLNDVSITEDGDYVVVTATYTYTPMLNILDIRTGLTFSSSAVMRTLQ